MLITATDLAAVVAYLQPQKLFTNVRVSEPEPDAGGSKRFVMERSGAFVTRGHHTSCTAVISCSRTGRRVLRLADFRTSNGPELAVYLSANHARGRHWLFDDRYVDLGRLKGNIGDQNYGVPDSVALAHYRSVVIWCRRFHYAFGAADLEVATSAIDGEGIHAPRCFSSA